MEHRENDSIDDERRKTDSDSLKNEIRTAFRDRAYPGDERILGRDASYVLVTRYDRTDDPDNPIPFVGKRWQEIDAAFFLGADWQNKLLMDLHPQCNSAHSFMTDEAFRYYLPAYMINSIDYYEELNPISDSIIYSLILSEDATLRRWQTDQYNGFSLQEVVVIIHFLEYSLWVHKEEYPTYLAGPKSALERYWYRRMEELAEREETRGSGESGPIKTSHQ